MNTITEEMPMEIYEVLPILIGLYMCMQKNKKKFFFNIVPSLN